MNESRHVYGLIKNRDLKLNMILPEPVMDGDGVLLNQGDKKKLPQGSNN